MKRPQTKFHPHTMSDSKAIRSKKSKFLAYFFSATKPGYFKQSGIAVAYIYYWFW